MPGHKKTEKTKSWTTLIIQNMKQRDKQLQDEDERMSGRKWKCMKYFSTVFAGK